MSRPYVVLSCCMSLDGYLDDASPSRLLLSNEADFARVDALRASVDAILVGAETIRRDDPRLLVRSAALQAERRARGLSGTPIKVTVTASGKLDPSANFFTAGDATKLVYASTHVLAEARELVGDQAQVVDGGESPVMADLVADLATRGVSRLMVEGGTKVLTQVLTAGLVDELQIAIAPIFVGQTEAPRFVAEGTFVWAGADRATLIDVQRTGDVAVLRYALSDRFAE